MGMGRGTCPYCGVPFNARQASIGTMQRCRACGGRFILQKLKTDAVGALGCAVGGMALLGFLIAMLAGNGFLSGPQRQTRPDPATPLAPESEQPDPPPPTTEQAAPVLPPPSPPAAPPVPVVSARERLVAAEGTVAARLMLDPAYRAALADLKATKAALDKARESGTPQEKIDASAAWNNARFRVDGMWATALAEDADVAAARRDLRR